MSIKKLTGSNISLNNFNQYLNKDILIKNLTDIDNLIYCKYYVIKEDINTITQVNQIMVELKNSLTSEYSFYYGMSSITKFIIIDIIFFKNTITPSLQFLESQLKTINDLTGYIYKHCDLIPYSANDFRIEIVLINRLNPLNRIMITLYDEVNSIYKLEIFQNIIKKIPIENIDLLVNEN